MIDNALFENKGHGPRLKQSRACLRLGNSGKKTMVTATAPGPERIVTIPLMVTNIAHLVLRSVTTSLFSRLVTRPAPRSRGSVTTKDGDKTDSFRSTDCHHKYGDNKRPWATRNCHQIEINRNKYIGPRFARANQNI